VGFVELAHRRSPCLEPAKAAIINAFAREREMQMTYRPADHGPSRRML
jgi:hypothetical protein